MFRFQCPECGFGDHEVGHLRRRDPGLLRCVPGRGGEADQHSLLGGRAGSGAFARSPGRRLSRRLVGALCGRLSLRLSFCRRLAEALLQRRHEVHDIASRGGWLHLPPHRLTPMLQKGIKVSDEEMVSLSVKSHSFHGEWNYTIAPRRPDR